MLRTFRCSHRRVHPMRYALAAVATLAITLQAEAREVAGVKLDETASVAGKELKLNGVGIRKATVLKVKVYVGALYVETPSKDGAAILAADQVMRVKQVFVRNVGKEKLTDAYQEDFKNAAAGNLDKYKDRIDKLLATVTDVKEGDEVLLTYVPGKGTTLTAHGADQVTLEGKDFAQLLFGFWLGPSPVDHGLQDGMLGK
jgi:Chalcone isomerase-like